MYHINIRVSGGYIERKRSTTYKLEERGWGLELWESTLMIHWSHYVNRVCMQSCDQVHTEEQPSNRIQYILALAKILYTIQTKRRQWMSAGSRMHAAQNSLIARQERALLSFTQKLFPTPHRLALLLVSSSIMLEELTSLASGSFKILAFKELWLNVKSRAPIIQHEIDSCSFADNKDSKCIANYTNRRSDNEGTTSGRVAWQCNWWSGGDDTHGGGEPVKN